MAVRAKVVCSFKKTDEFTLGQNGTQLSFNAVYSGSEENKQFFASSPGLSLQLFCVNDAASEQFELGKEYYLDFTPAQT